MLTEEVERLTEENETLRGGAEGASSYTHHTTRGKRGKRVEYRDFEEARAHVSTLGLTSKPAWGLYANDEAHEAWVKGETDTCNAELYKKRRDLRNESVGDDEQSKEWKIINRQIEEVERVWTQHGKLPEDIPSAPQTVYKGKGWRPRDYVGEGETGFPYWMGYASKGTGGGKQVVTLDEARDYYRKLKFTDWNSFHQWASNPHYDKWVKAGKPNESDHFLPDTIRVWREHGRRPDRIPGNPLTSYKLLLKERGIGNASAYMLSYGEYAEGAEEGKGED